MRASLPSAVITSLTELKRYFADSLENGQVLEKFRLEIVQKLAPGIHKPGYEELQDTSTTQTNPHVQHERPAGTYPIGRVYPPAYGPRSDMPFGNPDLDPLAASPGMAGPRKG